MRAQMKREMQKGSPDIKLFSELHHIITSHPNGDLQSETSNLSDKHELQEIVLPVLEIHDVPESDVERVMQGLINKLEKIRMSNSLTTEEKSTTKLKTESAKKTQEKVKKGGAVTIPEDFRCPISLELMRDPVIVSTGQVCKWGSNISAQLTVPVCIILLDLMITCLYSYWAPLAQYI